MTLRAVGASLILEERSKPKPGRAEVLSCVEACGVLAAPYQMVQFD
ncbi:MAG: hypothetical protein ABR929_09070 [Roseiarcus sp.]